VTAHLMILIGFADLLGAMLTLEVLGRAGRELFRPVAHVLEATLTLRIGRWVVGGAWLWIGFHFLAR
jgi:Family of unknown function (DUF6186)